MTDLETVDRRGALTDDGLAHVCRQFRKRLFTLWTAVFDAFGTSRPRQPQDRCVGWSQLHRKHGRFSDGQAAGQGDNEPNHRRQRPHCRLPVSGSQTACSSPTGPAGAAGDSRDSAGECTKRRHGQPPFTSRHADHLDAPAVDARLQFRLSLVVDTLSQPARSFAIPAIAWRTRQHEHAAGSPAKQQLDHRGVEIARTINRIERSPFGASAGRYGGGAMVAADRDDFVRRGAPAQREMPGRVQSDRARSGPADQRPSARRSRRRFRSSRTVPDRPWRPASERRLVRSIISIAPYGQSSEHCRQPVQMSSSTIEGAGAAAPRRAVNERHARGGPIAAAATLVNAVPRRGVERTASRTQRTGPPGSRAGRTNALAVRRHQQRPDDRRRQPAAQSSLHISGARRQRARAFEPLDVQPEHDAHAERNADVREERDEEEDARHRPLAGERAARGLGQNGQRVEHARAFTSQAFAERVPDHARSPSTRRGTAERAAGLR